MICTDTIFFSKFFLVCSWLNSQMQNHRYKGTTVFSLGSLCKKALFCNASCILFLLGRGVGRSSCLFDSSLPGFYPIRRADHQMGKTLVLGGQSCRERCIETVNVCKANEGSRRTTLPFFRSVLNELAEKEGFFHS